LRFVAGRASEQSRDIDKEQADEQADVSRLIVPLMHGVCQDYAFVHHTADLRNIKHPKPRPVHRTAQGTGYNISDGSVQATRRRRTDREKGKLTNESE
jgi:hypothetical protein